MVDVVVQLGGKLEREIYIPLAPNATIADEAELASVVWMQVVDVCDRRVRKGRGCRESEKGRK